MKYILALALALVLLIGSTVSAFPLLFDIWSYDDGGGSTWLGQISAYTGTESHADNYNYFSASGHPINGPTPTDYLSQAWLYYNTSSNTMSFNIIHNVDEGGGNYWNTIIMDLYFWDMDYGVILQDDDPENQGQAGFDDIGDGRMWADFAYIQNTDGGVVGFDPWEPCDWSIGIDPLAFGDIQEFGFASGDGGFLTGWTNPLDPPTGLAPDDVYWQDYYGPSFTITPHCEIPEPGTLMLLGTGLLAVGGVLRRRKK
jgi:hypothetical protein